MTTQAIVAPAGSASFEPRSEAQPARPAHWGGVFAMTLFVFAQGAHYLVWLRLVPDEARERPGVRSFRSSFEALRRDLGAPLLLVAGAFALLLAGRAFTSLEAARLLYLRGGSFHGFLEIAFALHVWSRK